MGQKQTFSKVWVMSALPPKADIQIKSMGLPHVHARFVLEFATFNALAHSSFSTADRIDFSWLARFV
jgi:hypothetical protein